MTDEDDASFADTSLLDAPESLVGADDFRAQPLYAYDCDQQIDPGARRHVPRPRRALRLVLAGPSYYADFPTTLEVPDHLAVLVLAGPPSTTISTGPIDDPFHQTLALLPSRDARAQ